MSFLKKIFGKSNVESKSDGFDNLPLNSLADDQLLKDIFVNPAPPVPNQIAMSPKGIKAFLDKDFHSMGYSDGYTSHSAESMKNQVDVIKSEFRKVLSEKIDELRQEMLEMESHLINIEGVDVRLEKQVQKTLEYFEEMKNDLEAEKALSALDEGMVMVGVHKYREGFVRGLMAFQEEKMLGSSTGMFY